VLDGFAANRLVILNDDTVEIAHDALLRAWPRLAGWLEDDRAERVLHSELTGHAAEWQLRNRDPAFLYRGTRLAAVRQAARRWEAEPARYPPLTAAAGDFLQASEAAADRGNRLRRIAAVGLAILLVAALGGAVAARNSATAAKTQRDFALSRQFAAQSEILRRSDPTTAQLLAAAAWRLAPIPEARYSMLAALADPLRAVFAHVGPIHCIELSPDGTTAATGGRDGVRIWDVATRRQIGAVLPGTERTYRVRFSPDGKTLAVAMFGKDRPRVRMWDMATRRPIATLPVSVSDRSHGEMPVFDLAYSANGKTLIAVEGDVSGEDEPPAMEVVTRDVATGRQAGTFPVSDARFELEGVLVGDFSDMAPLVLDGTRLVTLREDGTVRVQDVAGRRPLRIVRVGLSEDQPDALSSPRPVALSPDGKTLVTSDGRGFLVVWDVPSGRKTGELYLQSFPSDGMPGMTKFSPDGKKFAVDRGDGTVEIWEVTTSTPIGTLAGHTTTVTAIAFSRDGKTLITTSLDSTARIWRVPDVRQIGTRHDSKTVEDPVAYSPDGMTFAGPVNRGAVGIWDVRTGRRKGKPLTGRLGVVRVAVFSPDGARFALGTDGPGAVHVWDMAARRQIANLRAGSSGVNAMAFGRDGRTLATASDETVRIWDVASSDQIGTPFTGHSGYVGTVAFNPNGRELASTGDDGTVRIWDLATHRQIATLHRMKGTRVPVSSSPDGRTPTVGNGDGTADVWNTSITGNPFDQVCALAARPLTRAEWNRYAPDEQWHETCPN
jgi:WD40 repeat protein